MKTKLDINSLSFSYDTNPILKKLSFKVNEGDFVSIIGPNGSGKSTLLKNMATILKPRTGSIKLEDIDINQYKPKDLAKKIALVPQDTNIAYDFSVFDTVLMGRSPYINRFEREKEEDYRIVKESLKLTDTFYLKDRGILEISGGERQRVIIARALSQEPEIILLDEPTSHLDINHQIEILNLLTKLNKERKMTIIIVIHDINLASRFSNKMILLNEGKILSLGTPKEVIQYKNMKQAYDMDMVISHNQYTNSPYIIPLVLDNSNKPEDRNKKLHIISGGGSGKELLNRLDILGYNISMGVINIGDSDWETGKKLSVKIIEELPFSRISKGSYEKNVETIRKSDFVILTSVPYGRGNIKNLEAANYALKIGKKVYLIDKYNEMEKFDYVGGKAKEKIIDMKKRGLKCVESIDVLLDEVK